MYLLFLGKTAMHSNN